MHNHRQSFRRAGIERVRIEESALPLNHSAPVDEIFDIERVEPVLINEIVGAEGMAALPSEGYTSLTGSPQLMPKPNRD
jgi:hypothetical protein